MHHYNPPAIQINYLNKGQRVISKQTTCYLAGFPPVTAYPGQIFTIFYEEGDYYFGLLGNAATGYYCWINKADLE